MKPSFFARRSSVILLVVAFFTPLMFAGARQALRSNKNNVATWLPTNCEETTTYQWYRQRFESDLFVLVSWEGCTLDDPALTLLAKKLIPPETPGQDPAAAPIKFFRSALTGKQIVDELVEKQGLSAEEAIERLKGFVIGPDGRQTCLVLTVCQESEERWDALRSRLRFWWSTPKSEGFVMPQYGPKGAGHKFLHALVDHVREVACKECAIPEEKLHMGGPPVDNAAIDVEGERSLYRLAGVSAVIGLLMSWWCLRSWGLTLIVFTSSLFTAGLSLVAVWLCGARMNAVLMTMPSLVFVAATSAAIHLANYYRDTVRSGGFDRAPDKTVRAAWLPLALATGTTAVGLASLYVTSFIPIRMFGVYSAVGLVISFIVVCLYMPALLHFFPLRNIAQPAPRRFIDPGLSPRWRHVGEFVIRRSGWVMAACLVLMAVGTYGVSMTKTSAKLTRLFSPGARILQDYAWLETHLGKLVPMEVVIRIDKSKCELDALDQMILVSQVQQSVAQLSDVGSTLAASTFARDLSYRPSLIERQAWKTQLEKHRGELRDYLCTDGNEELWRVSARVAALTNLDYGEFVADIRGAVEPVLNAYRAKGYEGISAIYTGPVPLVRQAQSTLVDGLLLSFVGALILIGVAMILLLRNLSAGLLLAISGLFPVAVIFGALGWMGIVIDMGTVMAPAVALGVTAGDAISFMLRCRHGQQRGMTRPEAIMFAYGDCARAIYQSWGVIGLGLFSFALSSFGPTQRFGYLMFAMLTASSIGNLVLLPALLASPLGRFFWLRQPASKHKAEVPKPHFEVVGEPNAGPERVVIPMGRDTGAASGRSRAAADSPGVVAASAGRSCPPAPRVDVAHDLRSVSGPHSPGPQPRACVIEARELNKWYGNGDVRVHALRGIDLRVSTGEFVAVMGPSGSGKSTLLHVLGAVDVPTSGKVLFRGADLATLDDYQRTLARRRGMGFIFQSFNLLPAFSAEENVAMPLELGNVAPSEARRRALEMLEVVGIAHRRSHIPSALSGGEQQRVAIARALVTSPILLLADEPTGNLDSTNGQQVTALLRRLVDERQQTIVMVTHDAQVAGHADRLVLLRDGLIENEIAQGRGQLRTRSYSLVSR